MNCGYAGSMCGSANCGPRNFLTKKEKIEILNDYRESLENELKGLTERIKELEKN